MKKGTARKETVKREEALLQNHIVTHHLKVTKERSAVLRAFMGAMKMNRHVSAEELHHMMRKKGATIGLATIYRTLKLFCECGLSEERQFGDGHARFELTYNVNHHDHMVCTSCHQVTEFENLDIEKLQLKVAREHQFTIQAHKLELYGTCATCKK